MGIKGSLQWLQWLLFCKIVISNFDLIIFYFSFFCRISIIIRINFGWLVSSSNATVYLTTFSHVVFIGVTITSTSEMDFFPEYNNINVLSSCFVLSVSLIIILVLLLLSLSLFLLSLLLLLLLLSLFSLLVVG